MFKTISGWRFLPRLCFILSMGLLCCPMESSHGLTINSHNVEAMAIYGTMTGLQTSLSPSQIIFNVTDTTTINSLISVIDAAVERDCSKVGALVDAVVYIQFKNGAIEVYELFSTWFYFSKLGFRDSCYSVSSAGQTLFKTNAQ